MMRTSIVVGVGAVLLAASVGFAGFRAPPAGSAAAAAARPTAQPAPILFGTRQSDAKTPAMIAALREKARRRGVVRVIAGLRMAVRPEHRLPADEAALQAWQLLSMQQAVARRVLGRRTGDGIVAFPYIPYLSLFVDAIQFDRLLDDPDVVSIEEDTPGRALDGKSNGVIHAPDVWALGDTGQGYTIAILDSGVAACAPGIAKCPVAENPALRGRVVSEACYSTTSHADHTASFCPGGVADAFLPDSGVNCPFPRPLVTDCQHGTEVASVAAANGGGLEGVAKDATIISIQIGSESYSISECAPNPSPCAIFFRTDLIKGLLRVYQLSSHYKIAAANMSLGYGLYSGTCDLNEGLLAAMGAAVNLLRNAGIASPAAAGQDDPAGQLPAPACLSGATAVAASEANFTTYLEQVWPNSNYGSLIKLVAPGVGLKVAIPGGSATDSGTSLAAPQVAGAFALLKAAKPDASVADMEAALACTGKPVEKNGLWKPRIDLFGAYNYLLHPGALTAAGISRTRSRPSTGCRWPGSGCPKADSLSSHRPLAASAS